jgi:hypothetical protein
LFTWQRLCVREEEVSLFACIQPGGS